MGTKTLISLVGSNALPRLAPDLTWYSSKGTNTNVTIVSGINCTGGLTTVLSLTGAFFIHLLYLSLLTTNDIAAIKLTVDGVVIWNESGLSSNGTIEPFFGAVSMDNGVQFQCQESLLFELHCTADNSIQLSYYVRPIL